MNAAKIRLSPTERELVTDARFILTKNDILQKTKELLGHLQASYQVHLQKMQGPLPDGINQTSPKISRGENYQGLPWLVLDYPRSFTQSTVFAVRTMFWWGNFFSITLHLSGEYKELYAKKIIAAYPLLKKNGYSCNAGSEQWEHHFEKENYTPLTKMKRKEFERVVLHGTFIKLANKVPLKKWDKASVTLNRYFKFLFRMLLD